MKVEKGKRRKEKKFELGSKISCSEWLLVCSLLCFCFSRLQGNKKKRNKRYKQFFLFECCVKQQRSIASPLHANKMARAQTKKSLK